MSHKEKLDNSTILTILTTTILINILSILNYINKTKSTNEKVFPTHKTDKGLICRILQESVRTRISYVVSQLLDFGIN